MARMGMHLLAAIIAALLFLLPGCLGSETAGRCAQFSEQIQMDECLTYMATWYQDPYTCYEVKDRVMRGDCLEKSIDPKEARRLQTKSVATEGAPIVLDEGAKGAPEGEDRVSACMGEKAMSRDACVREIALEGKDILMCDDIGAAELRRSCIANVAISSKDIKKCSELLRNEDMQLCKYYSG